MATAATLRMERRSCAHCLRGAVVGEAAEGAAAARAAIGKTAGAAEGAARCAGGAGVTALAAVLPAPAASLPAVGKRA